MAKTITTRQGHLSAADTLEGAVDQWARSGTEIVPLSEPREVVIRDYHDRATRFYNAKQVEMKYRSSRRGQWSYDVLTFGKDRYGTLEEGGTIYLSA